MNEFKILFLFNLIFILSKTIYPQWIHMSSSPSGYFRDIVESGGVLYLASGGNGVYKSTDEGTSWQMISNGLNTQQAKDTYQVVDYNGALYVATTNGIYKSTNAGDNWIKKSNGITIGPGALYEFCESVFEYNGKLFTGAWNGIYRSTDGAENWVITNISGQGIKARNFVNHNDILFAAKEEINPDAYKSTDDGVTWEGITGSFYNAITFLSEPTKFWMGSINGVWLSTDNGTNWEQRSNGLSPDPYSSSIIRVNGKLITSLKFGGSGIFRSFDEGLNWEEWGEGLPFLNSIEKLIVFNDKILAATSNGLWQRDTSELITFTNNQLKSTPVSYKLYQNYPNPFNPSTKIIYSIPELSFVTLKVYDILGNEIATLVNEEKHSGNYEIEFNSHSIEVRNMPSEIYFYKLTTNNFSQTKKMILLK